MARGYFGNGVLLVTGDHRTMTIVRPTETARFGAGALSRVPMVVIGPSGLPPGAISGRWQQTDFLAGLLFTAGQPSCIDAFRGRLLGTDATTARYVLHTQGVQGDRVQVWVRNDPQPYELTMNGDDTGWVTQPKIPATDPVSYTHLRAHETVLDLVCRLLLEKKKNNSASDRHSTLIPFNISQTVQTTTNT